MTRPPDEKERADSLAGEVGSDGVEALPRRVERYGLAKSRALNVVEHIDRFEEGQGDLVRRMRECGEYLAFRHYFTVDQVRLHGASFCMKHLLCPLCAIRRGSKALKAYLDRWEVIARSDAALRPFLVTLTVRDGHDLAERFKHLSDAQRELWKRRHRGRGSVLAAVAGAVWSFEVKRGSGSGLWHPHLHMVAVAETCPDQAELAREWRDITGDSWVVDARPIAQDDLASGFIEVFKYALKFSDMTPADAFHAYRVLKAKRLIGSAGCFRGVDVPDELTDEPLDGLPFVEFFYRYLRGVGYALSPRKSPG